MVAILCGEHLYSSVFLFAFIKSTRYSSLIRLTRFNFEAESHHIHPAPHHAQPLAISHLHICVFIHHFCFFVFFFALHFLDAGSLVWKEVVFNCFLVTILFASRRAFLDEQQDGETVEKQCIEILEGLL